MFTRYRLIVAGTVLVLGAALAWAFAPQPPAVETAVVQRGHFEQFIEEDGRTRLQDLYVVSMPVTARLARMTLREGDAVAAGDAVATLMPVVPGLQDVRTVRAAQAHLKATQAGTRAAWARLEQAGVAQAQALDQWTRSAQLAHQGFTAPASLDHDRLALAAAQREVEAARAQHEVAVQEQAQAEAALTPSSLAAPAAPLVLRAPVGGTVLRVPATSEATWAAGTRVIEIGDPSRLEVVSALLTPDAMSARPGTLAMIERWGGPPVQARVRRIEPAAFTQVSALGIEEQRVHVVMDVREPPPQWLRMGDGFRVTVRIITLSAEDAVMVPVGALVPQADGQLAVYRRVDGRARMQTVQLGGRNARMAWVREGLRAGEEVIVYPPPGVTEGGRVRVRSP